MSHEYLIKNFLQKLQTENGLSLNTTASYGNDLKLFSKFLIEKKINFEEVKNESIKEYLYTLHQKKLRSASISRKISCLRNFYKFLIDENLTAIDPTQHLQTPKRDINLPKFLTEEEISKMLNFINSDKSAFGIKLSCMIEILYASGMRVSELVSLPFSAIQKEDGENLKNYLLIKGKGNKERIAPLGNAALVKLREYIQIRRDSGLENSKWLFVGGNYAKKFKIKTPYIDFHLTRQRFHRMLKDLSAKVGIDPSRVHPHVIRHSFATHLLNNGVDLRILQELLGHADISSTEIYTHILDSKLKDLVFKHHPLNLKILGKS